MGHDSKRHVIPGSVTGSPCGISIDEAQLRYFNIGLHPTGLWGGVRNQDILWIVSTSDVGDASGIRSVTRR